MKPVGSSMRELGNIEGMEAVDVLGGIDLCDHSLFIDMRWKRGLNKDAVDEGVSIHFMHERHELRLWNICGKFVLDRVQTQLRGLLVL